MRYKIRVMAGLIFVVSFAVAAQEESAGAARASGVSLAQRFLHVEELPRFRPVDRVGSFSSYDRTGGNDDGFSGKYSFLRKDTDGGLVIAELRGPGALTRIWTPQENKGLVEFYFDDESAPRLALPFDELFTGRAPPFVAPLSGSGIGGYYTYVPLEFAKSIKVVYRGESFGFYQINHLQYASGTTVRTFQPGDRARPPQVTTEGRNIPVRASLRPGETATLFSSTKPGRIIALKLGPADVLAGVDRDIVIRMHWDGAKRPAVDVPVGDFFGSYFGEPAARSLLFGTDYNEYWVRFPMPFSQSARIELVSQRDCGPPIPIDAQIVLSDKGRASDEGSFHAVWRREDPVPLGKPFTYLDVTGKGQLVGVTLQAQGAFPGQKTDSSRATTLQPSTVKLFCMAPVRRTSSTAAGTKSAVAGIAVSPTHSADPWGIRRSWRAPAATDSFSPMPIRFSAASY